MIVMNMQRVPTKMEPLNVIVNLAIRGRKYLVYTQMAETVMVSIETFCVKITSNRYQKDKINVKVNRAFKTRTLPTLWTFALNKNLPLLSREPLAVNARRNIWRISYLLAVTIIGSSHSFNRRNCYSTLFIYMHQIH